MELYTEEEGGAGTDIRSYAVAVAVEEEGGGGIEALAS